MTEREREGESKREREREREKGGEADIDRPVKCDGCNRAKLYRKDSDSALMGVVT